MFLGFVTLLMKRLMLLLLLLLLPRAARRPQRHNVRSMTEYRSFLCGKK